MELIKDKKFEGERSLFFAKDLNLENIEFGFGESPLKEGSNISLKKCVFAWKYPLWYSKNINMSDSKLLETARSGIWYTEDITIKNSIIEAPKTFRRAKHITLENVEMPNAIESFWNCEDINVKDVKAKGDYMFMNSKRVTLENFSLEGNYVLDGGKDIVVKNSKLFSKDSFWNCENVYVENSTIIGEYIGWNSSNITFKNCTISSLQGFCYMKNVKLIDCVLKDTTLSFEYSSVDAKVLSKIDSVKNPEGGIIEAKDFGEVIIDENCKNPNGTIIKRIK